MVSPGLSAVGELPDHEPQQPPRRVAINVLPAPPGMLERDRGGAELNATGICLALLGVDTSR